MTRTELNKKVGVLVHVKLKGVLSEDDYRTIVHSIDNKSGGFLRNCDDEHANLVLLHLQQLVDRKHSVKEVIKQSDQEKFIARLMEYLNWRWTDTSSFIRRVTGKHHTSKCDTAELSKVIRGMIAIIDKDIAAGKITLSGEIKTKYYRYTKSYRTPANAEMPTEQ